MKILRIIYDWPPPWDGLSPHPYELTIAQIKLGHDFEIFCGRWKSRGEAVQPSKTKLHTFFREPLPGTLNLFNSVWLFVYYIFWMDKNDVDIVHTHGHFAIWIYLYRFFLKRFFPKSDELKVPLVAHFHNTVAGRQEALEERKSPIKVVSKYLAWPLATMSDKWAAKVADACIFVSKPTLDAAIKHYDIDPKKCSIVESGVNVEQFSAIGYEEREKTRRELNLDPSDKVILYNGVMSDRKGTHLLIEALCLLPLHYKLLLVGPGEAAFLQKLTDLITQKNLEKRIVRVGYTPYPQIHIPFQISDLFCLPSSFEGLPKVVMQALACNVPALASGFKLSEEITGLYYLKSLDTENIASQIKELTEQEIKVDVAKVRRLYSWDERAREIEKVYDFVLKKR